MGRDTSDLLSWTGGLHTMSNIAGPESLLTRERRQIKMKNKKAKKAKKMAKKKGIKKGGVRKTGLKKKTPKKKGPKTKKKMKKQTRKVAGVSSEKQLSDETYNKLWCFDL